MKTTTLKEEPTELERLEQDLKDLDKAIVEKSNKFKLATFLSKANIKEDRKIFFKDRADLFEHELEILNEGHAKLSIKLTKLL